MNLTVNGVAHEVESAPLSTLLDVLREELGITSPKAGCEQGGCGACTVLVDGEPRRSCLTAVGAIDGAEVTTVEGLGTPDALSPVQQAFTPPLRRAVRLLHLGDAARRRGLRPGGGTDDPEAIQEALAGHVCRCTGYVKIIDAVAAVARARSSTSPSRRRAPG